MIHFLAYIFHSFHKYINQRYENYPVLLTGISMGASTVLFSLDKVNDSVKAAVVDSAYYSAYKQLKYIINNYVHLPYKITLLGVNFWCKLLAKFDLKDCDALKYLNNSNVPILFAHGTSDNFVKHIHTLKCYESYKADKELILVQDADHGLSYLKNNKLYKDTLIKFLNKYIK